MYLQQSLNVHSFDCCFDYCVEQSNAYVHKGGDTLNNVRS